MYVQIAGVGVVLIWAGGGERVQTGWEHNGIDTDVAGSAATDRRIGIGRADRLAQAAQRFTW